MAQHNEIGREGEMRAADYLMRQGYRILHLNWKAPRSRHELDIVAQDGDTLVIVEVKTRVTNHYGEPYEAVGYKKMCDLTKAANSYVVLNRISLPLRFDVISVTGTEINHIKDAFVPPPSYI